MRFAAAAAVAAAAFAPAHVSSVQLPANYNLYSLQPDGASLLATGDTTRGVCSFVRVSQTPLRVTAHGTTSCSKSAEPVHPVMQRNHKNFTVWVRIGRRDPRTGRVSEGPIVMTFQQYSDTQLETEYGPGTLWLFDADTSHGAEVVEVSTMTGRVTDVVRMPHITRPALAADEDGLWLAIAPNGGAGPGAAPIYHVSPGSHAPVLVHRSGRAALWIVAAGHTVVADVLGNGSGGELWRFDGASARARALTPERALDDWAASMSTDASSVWAVREVPMGGKYFECDSLQVIRIDAQTGKQTIVATIRTPGSPCYGATYSVFTGGAFSFLYGSKLYRVAD